MKERRTRTSERNRDKPAWRGRGMKLPHLYNGLYTWALVIRITRARSASSRFATARPYAAHVPGWILHV